jgi:hypothetical protein
MSTEISRRAFVKGALAGSMAVAGGIPAYGAEGGPPAGPPDLTAAKDGLPKGKIGKLEISRILLGGNLLTHYTHSRDLRYVYALAKHYNTEAKVLETLAVAEANGVNTLVIHTVPEHLAILRKHRKERGGKIQWIICPTAPVEGDLVAYEKQVKQLVDDGTEAIYLWGVRADELAAQGKGDLIAKAVELPKKLGVPSGVGAHALNVIEHCEHSGVPADFYIKTFHHHNYPSAKLNFDSSWCANPQETAAFMKGVEKPWIAFKVMAAGAIPPEDAFRHAFQNGADFCLSGMFDFEIQADVKIAREVLGSLKERERPWRG